MFPFKVGKRTYWFILIIFILCLITGLSWKAFLPAKTTASDIPLVRTQTVHINSSSQSYEYSGEVRGRYEIPLSFRVSGKVIQRNVDPGSIVNPGELLMQVDPSDIQLSVQAAQAQINAAESQMKLAKVSFDRTQVLYEQDTLSKAEYERSQSAYDAAEALYHQAIAQSQQSVNQLEYCSLQAPDAGIISAVNAQVGQVIQAGTPVLTLVKGDNLEVEINVPENRIENFRKAKQFKVSFWALPNIILDGQVREISPMADSVARTFKVRISLLNPPPEVRLGMTSTVMVDGVRDEPAAFMIPLGAVYQIGDTPSVWVVTNDTVSLRKIKIAKFADNQVQVSEGLYDGDQLVTAGVHKLMEGQKIRTENAVR